MQRLSSVSSAPSEGTESVFSEVPLSAALIEPGTPIDVLLENNYWHAAVFLADLGHEGTNLGYKGIKAAVFNTSYPHTSCLNQSGLLTNPLTIHGVSNKVVRDGFWRLPKVK